MNSKKQKHVEIQRLSKQNLMPYIGLAAGTALIVSSVRHLLKKIKGLPPKLPPIVIKSGSFIIETDDILKRSNEAHRNYFVYKRTDFKTIQGVRVFRFNETTGYEDSDDFEDKNGITVTIMLQRYVETSDNWEDIPEPVTITSEQTEDNSADFVLRISQELVRSGQPRPGRKAKYRDKEVEVIRFSTVRVLEADGGGRKYENLGDSYLISFYNELVR